MVMEKRDLHSTSIARQVGWKEGGVTLRWISARLSEGGVAAHSLNPFRKSPTHRAGFLGPEGAVVGGLYGRTKDEKGPLPAVSEGGNIYILGSGICVRPGGGEKQITVARSCGAAN